MVTIAIFSILATIAVPGFNNIVNSNRLTASVNNLHSTLSTARVEAIKRSKSISVERVGSSWSNGWVVYETDNSDTKLFSQDSIPMNISIDSSSSDDLVIFNAEGRSRVKHWGNNGVVFCVKNKSGRKIDVAPSGSISITEANCS